MPAHVFHLIPHTHWDREWYLPRAAFMARLVPAVDDLLARLDTDPEFRSFLLDGQTVLLEDYLRVRPEQRPRVQALVRAGRLQVGPWYVLADELIPSGESLVRNLLLGAQDAADLGGRLDVLYSPDAFGHPAIWPTLAAEFGIRWGVLWRGLGGMSERERRRGRRGELGAPARGRDLYRWRGPDGRAVLLYHLPPDGYEIGASLPADPERLPDAWARIRTALVSRAASRHVAVFVGADHHAVHPEVGRLRQLLAALEPVNEVKVSRLDEFFRAVEADVGGATDIGARTAEAASRLTGRAGHATEAERRVTDAVGDKLPILEGELRWSYGYTWTLQGVHATRAPLKRRHAECELWLTRVAEPLAALAMRRTGEDRRPLLRHAWRALVRSQFHDSIGGCTSDAVARQVEQRLGDVEAAAREIARASADALVGNDPDRVRERPNEAEPKLLLWNPAPRRRGGIVIADVSWFRRDVLVGPPGARTPRQGLGAVPFVLHGPDGIIPVQTLGQRVAHERLDAPHHYPDQDEVDVVRVAFHAPALGGFGLATLTPVSEAWQGRDVPGALRDWWGGRPGRPGGRDARPTGHSPEPAARARGRTLGNDLIEVTIERTGALRLLDRRTGQRYPDVLRLESSGDVGDTYTYCPPERDRTIRSNGPVAVRPLATGPLVAALEARWQFAGVDVRLIVSLHAGSPAVRCTLELDNQTSDHRLRFRAPTALPGGTALAGAQFGTVARPAVTIDPAAYPQETPATTAPAHRFVARAERDRGLAVFAPGFFEYELTDRGDLLVTLLRAVGQLSRADLRTRPGHAGWPAATPLAQCHGRERLQFGLCSVAEADLDRGDVLPGLWEDLFLPVRGIWLRQASPLDPPPSAIHLEGDGLVFSALKPAEHGPGMLLRCYNATPLPARGAWRFTEPIAAAHRVRADETSPEPMPLEDHGRTVAFRAQPHEIVTVTVAAASSSGP